MKKTYKILLLLLVTMFSGSTYAQEVYKGIVTDSESGRPISNVEVRFQGAKSEVKTDVNGAFTIERKGDTRTLVFHHTDYDAGSYSANKNEREFSVILHSNVRIDQYGQRVDNRKPLTTESWDGFIHWESKDKEYRMWMDNRVFLDGAYYMDNYDMNRCSRSRNRAPAMPWSQNRSRLPGAMAARCASSK